MTTFWLKSFKRTKRLIIALFGISVLLVGLVMIVMPGPAFIVIPVGLAILATEFIWARKILERITRNFQNRKTEPGNPK